MTTSLIDKLEEAIRESGEGWLIDSFAPPSEAMNGIRQAISELDLFAKQRLGDNSPNLNENAIVEEYTRNPTKIRAFFQALGSTHNPEMLLMVFRIIQGMEILNVKLSFQKQEAFSIQVVLQSPYGEPAETYRSQSVDDMALLRHFGILTIDNKPVLDGFYALRLGRSSSPLYEFDPTHHRITVDDVKQLLKQVPHMDSTKIESESREAYHWLLRNGVSTTKRLEELISSTEIFDTLAKIYREELKRPQDFPLDPVAVATWAVALFEFGLHQAVIESITTQIRQSPEYKSKNADN